MLAGKLIGYDTVEVTGATRRRKKETYTVIFDRKAKVKYGYRHEPKADQGYVAPEKLDPLVKKAAEQAYAERFNALVNEAARSQAA